MGAHQVERGLIKRTVERASAGWDAGREKEERNIDESEREEDGRSLDVARLIEERKRERERARRSNGWQTEGKKRGEGGKAGIRHRRLGMLIILVHASNLSSTRRTYV